MQWLRTVDSSLHSTLRTVPPTAPWIAAALHSTLHPATLHGTPRHHALASSLHSTLHSTFARLLWTAACTAQHHARLRPPCSTFENFCEQFPRAASKLLHSLCQTSPACSTLHSTFPRLYRRCEQQPATTCTTPWTAQHLCQTSPPHYKQQPHSRPAQHPAQHLCQTSQPQSEHQPAHHHAQDHSTAPLPDFATALTAPTAACTAPCTAPLPDFATKSATEDLTFEKYRTPIASSYLGKKDFAVILGGSSQKNHGRSPMRTEVIGPPTCARC